MRACTVKWYGGKPTLHKVGALGTRIARGLGFLLPGRVRVRFGEISFAQGFAGLGFTFFSERNSGNLSYIKFNLESVPSVACDVSNCRK